MIYDYECTQCGHKFEALNSVENRHNMKCIKCEGECVKLISNGKSPALHTFTPGYWHHIDSKPIWIKSPEHLKQECLKRWTPWNKPWPEEFLDGISKPGLPYDHKDLGQEGHPTKEELCHQKTQRLMEKVEQVHQPRVVDKVK